jgi:hypothetical protein
LRIEHIGDATLYLGVSMAMESGMFSPRNQFKIFDSIVGFIPVAVVDKLARVKRSAKMVFHNNPVLPSPASLHGLGADNDISAINGFPILEKVMGLAFFAHSLFLQTSATMRYSLSQRPLGNRFLGSAIASAHPIMQTASLLVVFDRDKPSEPLARQIRDFILSPVLCIGGNHVGTI